MAECLTLPLYSYEQTEDILSRQTVTSEYADVFTHWILNVSFITESICLKFPHHAALHHRHLTSLFTSHFQQKSYELAFFNGCECDTTQTPSHEDGNKNIYNLLSEYLQLFVHLRPSLFCQVRSKLWPVLHWVIRWWWWWCCFGQAAVNQRQRSQPARTPCGGSSTASASCPPLWSSGRRRPSSLPTSRRWCCDTWILLCLTSGLDVHRGLQPSF